MNVDEELVARALSAENVQRYLDGLIESPMPGTLADRVDRAISQASYTG